MNPERYVMSNEQKSAPLLKEDCRKIQYWLGYDQAGRMPTVTLDFYEDERASAMILDRLLMLAKTQDRPEGPAVVREIAEHCKVGRERRESLVLAALKFIEANHD